MPRLSAKKLLLIPLFSSFVVPVLCAVLPNQKLIALVPPGTQVVDGMIAPTSEDERGNFLILTHSNTVDFQDFLALTGADTSRSIHEVDLTASADVSGDLIEHSLLASGRFDRTHIYRSATDNGAKVARYAGIAVLSIEPFGRESAAFHDVRWLVIIDSDILLFGTAATVRQELDRYLAGNAADPSLIRRLDRLRSGDETWCLVATRGHRDAIHDALNRLDPMLARVVEDGGGFQFGIHYGRHIEFDYEVTTSSQPDSEAISKSIATSLAGPDIKGPLFLFHADAGGANGTVHSSVRISRRRYDTWLKKIYYHNVN